MDKKLTAGEQKFLNDMTKKAHSKKKKQMSLESSENMPPMAQTAGYE